MRVKLLFSILITMLFVALVPDLAYAKNLQYTDHLTISEGLSHNGITALLKDSKGYMWVGTYDGLNRYDGYGFQIYRNNLEKEILVSNRIRSLYEDEKGNILIGTDEGLAVYDYCLEKITNVYSASQENNEAQGPIIRKILQLPGGEIVGLTEGAGILFFSEDYQFIGQYFPTIDRSESYIYYDALLWNPDMLLLGSSHGLFRFDVASKKFTQLFKGEISRSWAMARVSNESVLITAYRGFIFLDYRASNNDFVVASKHYSNYEFHNCVIDENRNVWLGTVDEGVLRLEDINRLRTGQYVKESYFNDKSDLLRISYFLSNDQDCWVATFDKGLFRFSINENPFKHYNKEMDYEFGLQRDRVSSLAVYDWSKVLITVVGSGMSLFDTRKEQFEPLPFDIPDELINSVGPVFRDSRGNIWIGRASGRLYRVRKGKRKLELINTGELKDFYMGGTRAISEDIYGNIWFANLRGVTKVTLDSKNNIVKMEELRNHAYFNKDKLQLVRHVFADPLHNYVWVGTDTRGVFRIKNDRTTPLNEVEIENYTADKSNPNAISSNFVSNTYRLPNGDMWMATERGGICKVLNDDTDPIFISYSEKQGLSNNVTKGILWDDDYNLWVATNVGLNKFDVKQNYFQRIRKKDGLPFEDFEYASLRLPNGIMVFSSENGLLYFNPKRIKNKETLPPLEFDKLKVYNNKISPGDTLNKRVLLQKRLGNLERFELKHNENVFSLELNSLHFSNPDNHFLKYRLTPLNEEWLVVPSNERVVYYSGLQPREYTLEVMASNALNEWTEPKSLTIIINTPFWNTFWAWLLYVVFLIVVVVIIMRTMMGMQRLKHSVEIQHLEKKQAEEVNAAKLRFFSNIAHEIKTPLTLISGPLQLLKDRFGGNAEANDNITLVQRQAKKMSQLVDQVHDFQKSDKNLLKMDRTQFNFSELMREIKNDFDYLAQNTRKELELIAPQSDIFVTADKKKLEKIFNNLLNNAFKFTKENDKIHIAFHRNDKDLTVSVKDTGKGIDAEDLPNVFERFYQSKKDHSVYSGGSGIGLAFSKRLTEMHYGTISVESEFGVGTVFTVVLPVVEDHVVDDYNKKVKEIIDAEKNLNSEPAIPKEKESTLVASEEYKDSVIFLAEDNDDMRMFIEHSLSRFFVVKSFPNGKACLEALDKEWPDIVVSDVLMPELNGFDLSKKIKSDVRTSHIPIVLLTACVKIEDQIEGLKTGADAYMKKPFNMQHLVTRIETLLENRKLLRERYRADSPLGLEKKSDNTTDTVFLEKLYSLMAENLDNQDLDLNSFAKELYLNRTHFYQKVKALTNETPFELLKMYRLKKAAEMLVQENLPVTEVCMLTGFKSRTHFSKLFKEKYGVTPSKYGQVQE